MKRIQYKIEVKKNRKGRWFWRIKHNNGRILAHSESYSSLKKAQQTIHNLLIKACDIEAFTFSYEIE